MTHGNPIRIGCCFPVAYSGSSAALMHSPLCEKHGQVLNHQEYELWMVKARHPARPGPIVWRLVDKTPPSYWDSNPDWQEVDDDGYFERSESL